MVFDEKALSSLPPDVSGAFEDASDAASRILASRVRADDDAAYAKISRTMAVVKRTPAAAAEWERLFSQVASSLAKGKLSKAAVNRVLTLRGLPAVP